ncbi:transposase-like protein [Streptomyces sp. V4I23]|uniref:ISL3 family transposase n=1 Tax=Streptomyces sp. V4I23 TaxID=3042282 RepID=UPI0027883532|nr:ISL3 family transposase [Streptomyces sp. V4I23]MDQ1005990.1 transposase-like protein [Streptomyces sp. V4I23]
MSPHLDAVRVERVWSAGGVVRIAARTHELMVACPDCGRGSARVHSRYSRTLADVAVGGRPVRIVLSVRRLFCDSPSCGRRTFAEQVDGLTVRYQRRSPLLQHLVEMAGVLLAGRGGARLLHILRVPLSRTSVLFHLMRLSLPAAATPRVLGVDDFALYADVYGTLLVDADTRLPIELWSGRDAEQLTAWLRTHPGVEVVCRDGSLTYRQGITDGAPDAVQVSDRFHLWQGMSRRVSDIAAAHRGCLTASVPEPEPAAPSPPPAELPEVADTPAQRHAKRLFEAVRAASVPGRSLSAIARELGLNRRTVAKYARAVCWQECVRRTPPRRSTTLVGMHSAFVQSRVTVSTSVSKGSTDSPRAKVAYARRLTIAQGSGRDLRVQLRVREARALQAGYGGGAAVDEHTRPLQPHAHELRVDGGGLLHGGHQAGVAAIGLQIGAVGVLDSSPRGWRGCPRGARGVPAECGRRPTGEDRSFRVWVRRPHVLRTGQRVRSGTGVFRLREPRFHRG